MLDLTHEMIMIDLVAIGVETSKLDRGSYLKKEFSQLILKNP